jgi:hypothetical protein
VIYTTKKTLLAISAIVLAVAFVSAGAVAKPALAYKSTSSDKPTSDQTSDNKEVEKFLKCIFYHGEDISKYVLKQCWNKFLKD